MGRLHPQNRKCYVLDRIYIWLLIHKNLTFKDLTCPEAAPKPNFLARYATGLSHFFVWPELKLFGCWFESRCWLNTILKIELRIK
jgi:hypothetical protein